MAPSTQRPDPNCTPLFHLAVRRPTLLDKGAMPDVTRLGYPPARPLTLATVPIGQTSERAPPTGSLRGAAPLRQLSERASPHVTPYYTPESTLYPGAGGVAPTMTPRGGERYGRARRSGTAEWTRLAGRAGRSELRGGAAATWRGDSAAQRLPGRRQRTARGARQRAARQQREARRFRGGGGDSALYQRFDVIGCVIRDPRIKRKSITRVSSVALHIRRSS